MSAPGEYRTEVRWWGAVAVLTLALVAMTAAGCSSIIVPKVASQFPWTDAHEQKQLMGAALDQYVKFITEGRWEEAWDFYSTSFRQRYPREVFAEIMRSRGIRYSKVGEPDWGYRKSPITVTLPFKIEGRGRVVERGRPVKFYWVEENDFGWEREDEPNMPPPGSVQLQKQDRPAATVAPSPAPATPPPAAAPTARQKRKRQF